MGLVTEKVKKEKVKNSSKQFSLARRIGVEDASAVADIGFKKQLWALDPELDVVWNHVKCRWEIWRFPGQKEKKVKKWNDQAHYVMIVETKTKSFRQLGSDLLLKLQKIDTRKYTLQQLVEYFDQMDRNIQREKERNLMNQINAMNRELIYYTAVPKLQVPKEYLFEIPSSLRVKRALAGGL